jgi:hypothetical protein
VSELSNAEWVDEAVRRALGLFPGFEQQVPVVRDFQWAHDDSFPDRLIETEGSPLVVALRPDDATDNGLAERDKLLRLVRRVPGPIVIDCARATWLADLLNGLEKTKADRQRPPGRQPRGDAADNPFQLVGTIAEYFNKSTDIPSRLSRLGGDNLFKKDALLRGCASNLDPLTRARDRENVFHGSRDAERFLQLQLTDLCTALLLLGPALHGGKPVRMLWFENRPDDSLADVLGLPQAHTAEGADRSGPATAAAPLSLRGVLSKVEEWLGNRVEVYLISRDFGALHGGLLGHDPRKAGASFHFGSTRALDGTSRAELDFSTIQLFLIDIYLEDSSGDPTRIERAGAAVDGIALQEGLDRLFPGVPAVIVSSSEDYEETRRVFKNRGEFFLPKKQFLSLPLLYLRSIEELGPALSWIRNPDLRAHATSLVRRWSREPAYLWFGDKCYHMIDHSLPHVLDDWRLFNQLAAVIQSNRWIDADLEDEEIYLMLLAVWLHDIGHKGNERYGEAHQIRDSHGILSAEFILKHPKLLEIQESKWFQEPQSGPRYDTFYEGKTFPTKEKQWHLVRVMVERHRGRSAGLSTLEKAALLAMFHKSNAPVSRAGALGMEMDGKHIPVEYAEDGLSSRGTVISLEEILEAANPGDAQGNRRFLQLVFLFRLVDGLDVNKVRVGSAAIRDFKGKVVEQDLRQMLTRLRQQVDLISMRVARDDKALALALEQRLYSEPAEKILGRTFKLDSSDVKMIEELIGPQTDYWQILNFAAFISVQSGHFDLHGSVDSLEIGSTTGPPESRQLKLRFTLNRPYEWLSNTHVKEMRKDSSSLWIKLFGNDRTLPYAIQEFRDGFEHLKEMLRLERGVQLEVEFPCENFDATEERLKGPGRLRKAAKPGWAVATRQCTGIGD